MRGAVPLTMNVVGLTIVLVSVRITVVVEAAVWLYVGIIICCVVVANEVVAGFC